MTTLEIVSQESGLELESANQLKSHFDGLFLQAEEWKKKAETIKVTDVLQVREMKLARESRLALRESRINTETKRKELKEDSLRRGKAIDGIANVIKFLIEPVESYLLTQEKFAERVEEARVAALIEERSRTLSELGVNPGFYRLGEMSEADFDQIVNSERLAKLAAIGAQRKADEERIKKQQEEATERERIKKENETLKKQAEEREATAKAEREAREKLEAEKLAAKRAEEKRAADEAAEIDRKNSAPDREKLIQWAQAIAGIEAPVVNSKYTRLVTSALNALRDIAAVVSAEASK